MKLENAPPRGRKESFKKLPAPLRAFFLALPTLAAGKILDSSGLNFNHCAAIENPVMTVQVDGNGVHTVSRLFDNQSSKPTPHGDVEVSWKWTGGRISLDATIPTGTEAEVVLPDKTYQASADKNHFQSASARAANGSL